MTPFFFLDKQNLFEWLADIVLEWQLRPEVAVVAMSRGMLSPTRHGHGGSPASIDIVEGDADEGIVAPFDAAIVEEDVLTFAAVITAVHHFHIRARRI